jgi:hypothetical protein
LLCPHGRLQSFRESREKESAKRKRECLAQNRAVVKRKRSRMNRIGKRELKSISRLSLDDQLLVAKETNASGDEYLQVIPPPLYNS